METVRATIGPALAGRYAVECELGEGAMALVFLASDLKHDRKVAIKVLKPELASAIGSDRFHREIEVVAGLAHPHILALYDSGEASGLLYFVMPYIEGESLRERLRREQRLPIADALRITREVAGALGFAHRHGVVHRDVKPANIMLTEDHALLADFGIAHLVEPGSGTLTDSGTTLGTPEYMSPEQATGDSDLDGRSDVYSLGCVLYELLAGEPPFAAASVRALITKHLSEDPPRVRKSRPEVSDGLEAVVQTAMQKDPDGRFQTADEMAGSLDLVSGGFEAMAAATLRKLIGPRHRWLHGSRLASLVTAAVLVLIAGGILLRDVLQRPAFAGRYPTYAVLPDQRADLTEEEREITREAAEELRWHLSDWESIGVVEGAAMEGPSELVVRAGFEVPTTSLRAGIRLLETLNASHLIQVSANAGRDSVELAARIYENVEPVREERRYQAAGVKTEIRLITANLAMQILELNGEPAELPDLVQRSPYHTAQQEFDKGRDALLDWRLAEAEEHFRNAIGEDSLFAWAHFQLATTMYWRTVRDPERILDGETIHRHVERANLFANERPLRYGERRDLEAFRAFWEGDYETARTTYAAILADEPTNLDALVLAGAIEYADPWLAADSEGNPVGPRGDLNLARAVFDSAVGLDRHRQLAWGRLFEVARDVAGIALGGHCHAYVLPDGRLIPPYVFPEAANTRAYCPYIEDGRIRWRPDSLSAGEREATIAGARAMRTDLAGRLDFWQGIHDDQPRPHEELADWMLWERSVKGCEADPAWADSLLLGALTHTEEALEIRRDTTPQDRLRLGALLLATGDVSRAEDHTDRAIAELGDWRNGDVPPPPKFAGNVYMAAGDGLPAAQILEAVDNQGTWSTEDSTVEAGSISGGPVWGTVWALGALGMTEADEALIVDRFQRVQRTWAEMGYTARQQALLRSAVTSLVSPALLQQPERWSGWFGDWERHGLEIPPVWKGLLVYDERPDEATDRLEEAIRAADARPAGRRRATHYYMPIKLAERLRDTATVAELSTKAVRCPLRVDTFEFGWGMGEYLAGETRD